MSYDELRYHNDTIDFFGPPKAKPCTCVATRDAKLDARMADGRRRLDNTIAELTAMRIEREQREADRIERERLAMEREELERVQAELNRAHSIAMAKRDYAAGLAAGEQAARDKIDADQSLAAFRIALRDMHRTRRAEDIARERADRDQQKRWRGGR